MPLTATQTLGAGAAIKSEASGTRSREAITIPSGIGTPQIVLLPALYSLQACPAR